MDPSYGNTDKIIQKISLTSPAFPKLFWYSRIATTPFNGSALKRVRDNLGPAGCKPGCVGLDGGGGGGWVVTGTAVTRSKMCFSLVDLVDEDGWNMLKEKSETSIIAAVIHFAPGGPNWAIFT